MKALYPFIPYLLLAYLFGIVRLYCYLCCRPLLKEWKEVNQKLKEDPENQEALKREAELQELSSLFPECLLHYRIFTYPYDPIDLRQNPQDNESS